MARQLTGRIPQRRIDGKWEYTSEAAREEARIEAMELYIWRRQNTVAQFIDTRLLLELCEKTERIPGARVGMWWWEQAGLKI